MNRYTVMLSNRGNPDFRQDPNRTLPGVPVSRPSVASLAAASAVALAYIMDNDLGSGNWHGGEVKRIADKVVVGYVAYNGKVYKSRYSLEEARDDA